MSYDRPCRIVQLRHKVDALLDGRDETGLRRQPHPELSPLLWHVGHVFFVEHYWLADRVFGDTALTGYWQSLYFPEYCPKAERTQHLPGRAALRAWTAEVAARADHYWARSAGHDHRLLDCGYLANFIAQHYAQHLETMRLAVAQLDLGEARGPIVSTPDRRAPRRIPIAAHRVRLGTAGVEGYDNEKPTHVRDLDAFDIAEAPVSNAQWLAFIADGGYRRPEFWDPEGWRWRCRAAITHPQHWQPEGAGWRITDDSDGATDCAVAPVHGIGWYEARAYARYAGARLPHEHEWEAAERGEHLPATGRVWEWCDNALAPYPGFRPFPYDGYSLPWFDGRHFVARGASRHSEDDIRRAGFRNFYPPTHRHICAGLRLAWSRP